MVRIVIHGLDRWEKLRCGVPSLRLWDKSVSATRSSFVLQKLLSSPDEGWAGFYRSPCF